MIYNNEKELIKLIEGNELYFTSETGREAEKNAFESLSSVTKLEEPELKLLGTYEGEDLEINDLEIIDGDNIYTLV